MESPIKCLVFKDGNVIISEIGEISSEVGEPNCKLTNPFKVEKSLDLFLLEPWLNEYTNKSIFMINSDCILTIIDPNKEILKKYIELVSG